MPKRGLRIWIGGYPPPPGWDSGMVLGDGLVAMWERASVIDRVSVPEHAQGVTEALAGLISLRGMGDIAVEVRT